MCRRNAPCMCCIEGCSVAVCPVLTASLPPACLQASNFALSIVMVTTPPHPPLLSGSSWAARIVP